LLLIFPGVKIGGGAGRMTYARRFFEDIKRRLYCSN
jgi:hypothetical protein